MVGAADGIRLRALSAAELASLQDYQQGLSEFLNPLLRTLNVEGSSGVGAPLLAHARREGQSLGEVVHGLMQLEAQLVALMDTSGPLGRDAELHRTQMSDRSVRLPEVGEIVTDHAFLSTSFDPSYSAPAPAPSHMSDRNFVYITIEAPALLRGIDMAAHGHPAFVREAEFLVRPGTPMKVVESRRISANVWAQRWRALV